MFCTSFEIFIGTQKWHPMLPNSSYDVANFVMMMMQAGGPSYAVELGRLDGLSSTDSSVDGKLPQPTFNLTQLNSLFAANGLEQSDVIALSGTFPLSENHHADATIKMSR